MSKPWMSEEDFKTKRSFMTGRDWPARTVDEAYNADVTRSALAQLAKWDVGDRNVAVLSGKVGCGKSVAAARWCMARTTRIGFVRAATFAAIGRYDVEARARYYGADGLCIDDLGAEYADKNGSFLVDMDEIIDTYYADKRPLLITTNLPWNEFSERYGARVTDRVKGCAMWIQVLGESMRTKK